MESLRRSASALVTNRYKTLTAGIGFLLSTTDEVKEIFPLKSQICSSDSPDWLNDDEEAPIGRMMDLEQPDRESVEASMDATQFARVGRGRRSTLDSGEDMVTCHLYRVTDDVST